MSNIITIDGPASSGKSTVGFLFARKIGYQFIDTGLIYRVGSLLAKRANQSIEEGEKCALLLSKSEITFKTEDSRVRVFLNQEDVTDLLKTPEIDKIVPVIAAHREVREAAKGIQRRIGLEQDTVMAGRDIGSEIFPQAQLKFFVTASVEARAKRRYEQLVITHPQVKLETIESEIRERDQKDSTRAASPMRVPVDAISVDTSNMTINEAVERLMDYVRNIQK